MDQGKMYVVIVGGSLSGLMHGIVAKRLGHKVAIFERHHDAHLAQQGAGIGLSGALDAFMREYNAIQQDFVLCPPKGVAVDPTGQVIHVKEPGISATSWSILYYLLRANFDGLRSTHCQQPPSGMPTDGSATYVHDRVVTDVQRAGRGMLVEYLDKGMSRGIVSADLVVVAEGSGSKLRDIFAPRSVCRYVGYAAWRGMILETEVSEETRTACQGNDRYCQADQGFFLSYTIPGKDGSLDKRLRNWVWYRNFAEDGGELRDVLLDCKQRNHKSSLPPGTLRKDVWERQRRLAQEVLDAHSAELVSKTTKPFFQAITEVIPEKASFCDGRLLIVGDALAVIRPLSGMGTGQAANSALLWKRVLLDEIELDDWERAVLEYAKNANMFGIAREQKVRLGNAGKIPVDGVI